MSVNVTGGKFPEGGLSSRTDGPSVAERAAQPARAVAEATCADGVKVRSVIETVNGYSYTPLIAVETARRILGGEHRSGFETPARLFGIGFAETIDGTRIIDMVEPRTTAQTLRVR